MIDLAPEHRQQVKRIFNKYLPGVEVRVFGSRVKDTASRFSDLDLVLLGKTAVNPVALAMVKDELSESTLPFLVDILDWTDLSAEFKDVINEKNEPL